MKCDLLLIDDEPCIREALAELLSEDDVTVTTAANGKVGLDLLTAKSFDIVVSDIKMPLMDGLTLMQEARSKGIFCPFIFFTAHISDESQVALRALRPVAIVKKPHFEKLSAELNSILVKKEFLEATDLPVAKGKAALPVLSPDREVCL